MKKGELKIHNFLKIKKKKRFQNYKATEKKKKNSYHQLDE